MYRVQSSTGVGEEPGDMEAVLEGLCLHTVLVLDATSAGLVLGWA